MPTAYSIKVRGLIQGVGFRPFVYNLARANGLKGWVLNAEDGVEIRLEGEEESVRSFLEAMNEQPPQAALIADVQTDMATPSGFTEFRIRDSIAQRPPSVRISPDLPVCPHCLRELFDPQDRRYRYPYINCTNCGPRFSVIRSLPYDRPNTTMAEWVLDETCDREYADPLTRRFHVNQSLAPLAARTMFFDLAIRPFTETIRPSISRPNFCAPAK